ncbi:MAG: PstS family phosphate ABC transporter substrate-binding protein [Mycobacteriales bacterium]
MLSRQGTTRPTAVAMGLALTLALAACGGDKKDDAKSSASASATPGSTATAAPSSLPAASAAPAATGTVDGDGSSTVFPIMEGVAEELTKKGLKVTVGESGTGGGFKKFCAADGTDFSNASRAIKDDEKAICEKAGVEFEEFKIASDGLAIVSNKDFKVDCLSMEELKKTFEAGSTVKKGSDINADVPADDIKLFTPGADSGTYDFFAEAVLGKDVKYRADGVTTSEDDNVLVTGIEGTKGGLGFFGFSYFSENADKLNLVGVKGKGECVKPSAETVLDGSYPLSRPLYIYVNKASLARPEVKEMMKFVLGKEGRAIITEVQYVELPESDYEAGLAKLG